MTNTSAASKVKHPERAYVTFSSGRIQRNRCEEGNRKCVDDSRSGNIREVQGEPKLRNLFVYQHRQRSCHALKVFLFIQGQVRIPQRNFLRYIRACPHRLFFQSCVRSVAGKVKIYAQLLTCFHRNLLRILLRPCGRQEASTRIRSRNTSSLEVSIVNISREV
jgi:hypothetical protein